MGGEQATLQLIPRASARSLVAGIAAARQARCEKLAQLVAQTLACESSWDDHRLKSVPLPKMSARRSVRHAPRSARIRARGTALPARACRGPPRRWPPATRAMPIRFFHQRCFGLCGSRNQAPRSSTGAAADNRRAQSAGSGATAFTRSCATRFAVAFDCCKLMKHGSSSNRCVRLRERTFGKNASHAFRLSPGRWAANWQVRLSLRRHRQSIRWRSRHGQTLRFHGLPFARVRRVMEQDRVCSAS